MTDSEREAIKELFPEHAFARLFHPLGEAIIAIPKVQSTPEKNDAVTLMHGATIKLSA